MIVYYALCLFPVFAFSNVFAGPGSSVLKKVLKKEDNGEKSGLLKNAKQPKYGDERKEVSYYLSPKGSKRKRPKRIRMKQCKH